MKKLMLGLVAAFAVTAFANPSVKINNVETASPWVSGEGTIKVDYSLAGIDAETKYKVVFDITADGKTASVTNGWAILFEGRQSRKEIDTAKLFGEETVAKDAEVKISLITLLGGVQLWEGGPFFAECNVGATKPEEYGYYFWWGDTVGYKRNGTQWDAVDGSATSFNFKQQNCPTFDKDVEALENGGWIDDSGNLVVSDNAAKNHDAARAYLGAPWRMMTEAELQNLSRFCTSVWTNNYNNTGINGRLVKGNTEGYKDKSIFLPAAGYGNGSNLPGTGLEGHYWSSPPNSSLSAQNLDFDQYSFGGNVYDRSSGYVVRPVR